MKVLPPLHDNPTDEKQDPCLIEIRYSIPDISIIISEPEIDAEVDLMESGFSFFSALVCRGEFVRIPVVAGSRVLVQVNKWFNQGTARVRFFLSLLFFFLFST